MSALENVNLEFENIGDKPGVKITRPNSALNYIKQLLAEGFRGNINYYRDNDRRLILKVWEHEGLVLNKEQRGKFLYEVTFPDSITRARRQLREQYPESQLVMRKRYNLFTSIRHESNGGRIKRLLRA